MDSGRGNSLIVRHIPPWVAGVWALAIGAALSVTLRCALAATTMLGQPFPSLLVDPFGAFSAVSFPSWGTSQLPLRFPDQLTAIDGERVDAPNTWNDLTADRLARKIADLSRRGHRIVRLTFERAGRPSPVVVEREIRSFRLEELITFFGLYAADGLLVLWSGLIVLSLAHQRPGARAFALWALAIYLGMTTIFDYHTTHTAAPLFSLSTVLVTIGFLWLAYAFPEPPHRWRALTKRLLVVGCCALALAAAALLAAPAMGLDVGGLRFAISIVAPLSAVLLVVILLVRVRNTEGRSRSELLWALWSLVTIPPFLAIGILLPSIDGNSVFHLAFLVVMPAIPLSVGYSLVRHNILASTAVLMRRMIVVPVFLIATIGVLAAWLIGESLAIDYGIRSLEVGAAMATVFMSLLVGGHRLAIRVLFPAVAEFRPTLEQLSEQLASFRRSEDIKRVIVEAVGCWLPTNEAAVLERGELDSINECPDDTVAILERGQAVWTLESPLSRHLLVPMRFLGELRAIVFVGPKHQAALYTTEDLALLSTIATLGAIALQHIRTLDQLELLRRLEVDVTRDEKRQALALIAAEVVHEVAYPLNFFRHLLRRASEGQGIAETDLDIGREEVERLERMLGSLRRLKSPPTQLRPVRVRPALLRALELLRYLFEARDIHLSIDVDEELVLLCDEDPLLQLFANLLRNALQAVPVGGHVGVRSDRRANERLLEVWDDGPGIPPEVRDVIFNALVSTKPGGSGLGLAVAQRIARSFGWTIAVKHDGRTRLVVTAPDTPQPATQWSPHEHPGG